MNNLEEIGFNTWVQSRLDADMVAAHEVARVASVHKDRYIVTNGVVEVFAELSGKVSYTAESPVDLPTTGDWVYADFYDEHTHAIIHGVAPRKTLLKRKAAGKVVEFQLIAANIDVAFIMQSADHNYNLRRLERYLVMVNESGITPVILLSKCDLISPSEANEMLESISRVAPHVSILPFSNVSGDGIDAIVTSLSHGHTYCLLGSSGVGKTTLLNHVLGKVQFKTQSVSTYQSKGKHTTTSRELVQLENGALLIDTPGMRELGNMSVGTGIDETFAEISELSHKCTFGDCSHRDERGCAVLAAIETGELSEQRYNNYMKLKKESAHNEMSYFERRKKDKAFGKMIKSTMKHKKR